MTQIERMDAREYNDIFALSEFAFQYKLDEHQRKLKEEEAERHQIYGYKVEGQLAGKLHIIPLHIYIGEHLFKMGGISSVATWPEYRRQGIAKALLLHSLKEMKESGQTVSLLHPFHVGFYRKYGWELTYYNKKYTIPIQQLKRKRSCTGSIRRTTDIDLIAELYTAYAKKFNGMLERDKAWWNQRVLTDEEAQMRVAYDTTGEAEGYLIYKVKKNVMTVIDMAYISQNGLHLIYDFIGNHDSMAQKVEITVPENDILPLTLDNPVFEQKLEPYFMARIVDVQGFLSQYPFKGQNETVVLKVEDEWIDDNNGCYEVNTMQGETLVTKVEDDYKANIQCSIQQLTSLLFAFKNASELYAHGFITGDETVVSSLQRMIPERQTFFTDFF